MIPVRFRSSRYGLYLGHARHKSGLLDERKFWCILFAFAVSFTHADTASAPSEGDLLSQYDQPAGGPGFFSKLIRSFGLKASPARAGNRAYQEKDYDKALQKYAEASLDAPGSQALAFNSGAAEFRKKRYDDAIKSFTRALQGKDASIAAKSHYNLGNSHFRKGEAALLAGKQEGISEYREALAHYKKNLELTPENQDAKRNIEVVQARIKELLDKQEKEKQQQPNQPQKPPEPSAKAREALARALQLIQQRRYGEGKAVLEQILTEDPTAASFQSHLQRLDDIMKILKGEQPSDPTPQDPRAQQGGMGVI